MSTPTLDAETITSVVGEVFVGLFGEDDGRPYPDEHGAALPVTASVRVSGASACVVGVDLGHELVVDAAARLFGIPAHDVTEADLRDVAGELANVVGGNVKSMLPGPATLSLPVTALDSTGPEPADLSIDLSWRRQPLRVRFSIASTEGNPS